jgi:hypothetical protein
MEGERDFRRHELGRRGRGRSGAGRRDQCRPGIGRHTRREGRPVGRVDMPAQPELGEARRRRRPRRRFDLGRRQQVSERIQVVPDADAPFGARLERCRAAAREWIEDDVTRPRIAGDEGVRKRGWEAREVRAHRMEGVAPQPLLSLPFGLDRDRRQRDRQVQGQLLRGGGRSRASRSGRHGRIGPLTHAPIPAGAMGRGV